ncbi:hypothetical protein BC936DRAFT_137393 [Jimgerdemannia flammicorona]|uniref:Exocyst complex component EXO84 n=1 Tax=Jimgerdemannia flammicorona TaxID=994334 RepID=A0A433CXH4_9FUNG|nr:hypothetical protein BC936DRAFT_137393 [Jimgerdemannia flammicorona]
MLDGRFFHDRRNPIQFLDHISSSIPFISPTHLESDMLTLRNLLNDLRSINDSFKDDSDTLGIISGILPSQQRVPCASQVSDSVIPRRKPNEGVNTDMHSLHKAQMQALWEGVEGSQKFVPFLPNRHIVKESGNFVELNPSNFKPKQGIHLFLLSDCLLVATRKKRTMSSKLKLVAEQCWPLNEIAVIDIKDSPARFWDLRPVSHLRATDIVNAFKVIKNSETFYYRAEKLDDKTGFLVMVKRNTDEMMEEKRRQRDAMRAKTESVMIIAGSETNDLRNNLSKVARKPLPPPPAPFRGGNEDEDAPEKSMSAVDMRWMANLPDELDVCIAQREFEAAVAYVENGGFDHVTACMGIRLMSNRPPSHSSARSILSAHGGDSAKLEAIRREIDRYVDRLCTAISRDLSHPLLTKVQFQRNCTWLLRLDLGEEAREVFMAARTNVIKQRTRQLTFEGDVTTYISELALVVFTLIRNTCDWYRESFKDNRMASGEWKLEGGDGARLGLGARAGGDLRGHLPQAGLPPQPAELPDHRRLPQVDERPVRYGAFRFGVRRLRMVGLDLNFLLEELFEEDVRETIAAYEERCLEKLAKVVANDNFAVVSSQSLGGYRCRGTEVKVTASVVSFYNILIQFVNDVCLLAKLSVGLQCGLSIFVIRLYIKVIDGVSSLTEQYLKRMKAESRERDLSKDQRYAAKMNVSFVLDNIVPRISGQLNRHFDRPIPELDTLRARLRGEPAGLFVGTVESESDRDKNIRISSYL